MKNNDIIKLLTFPTTIKKDLEANFYQYKKEL